MVLPEGTITFLFTDIEDSTRLWEQETEAMRQALARHDDLLPGIIKRHGGTVIKTTGDGLQTGFSAGIDAVRAALAIQDALKAESWPEPIGRLRVRIGLLTGTAEFRDGDYHGPAVNRAARLMDAGHGDQILLAKTTRELVGDALPAGVSTRDLGEYHLRGVARPERIYQLLAPGLPAEFPPLRVVPVQLTNLPPRRTPFISRDRELNAVIDLLRGPEARLVTLLGQGGSGKTRLAMEIAERLLPAYEDGVFFVDLAPLTSPELLPSAVANVLGLAEAGQQSLSELVRRHLSHKQMLLVLDNFEHLLAAADLLPQWLASSPGLALLATSRAALNLQEEWLYPIGGLPYPQNGTAGDLETYGAVQLFVQSALRVRPEFSLDDETAGVVRICQIVEGLPLAIELAASWTKTLDSSTIAGEIQRNADFLATRLRNVPERHRSMLAAFEYSWQLLKQPEQTAFTRLAVFRGGFDRAAAQAVTGASPVVLTALVDKSLLHWRPGDGQGAGGRYRIHELLRQFAEEKLIQDAEEAERIHDQHTTYYTTYIQELLPLMLDDRQLEATAKVTAEIENIRVAWQWATERADVEALNRAATPMADYYQFKGRYIEGQIVFLKAAEALAGVEKTQRVEETLGEIWLDLAYFDIRLGFLEEAEAFARESHDIYQRYGKRPGPGMGTDPRIVLGLLASIKGDHAATGKYGEEVRQTAEADGNIGNRPLGTYLLTRAALAQGDYEAALRYARQGCAMARETGERWFNAYALNEMGNVEFVLGNYAAARENYETAYNIRREFDDPEGAALAALNLGIVALREQNNVEAEKQFRHGLDIYEELNDRGGLARALEGLGQAAANSGQLRTACDHYQRALEIAAGIHFVPVVLSLLGAIGEFFMDLKEPALGLECLARVASHPAAEYETKQRAEKALARYRNGWPEKLVKEAVDSGTRTGLQTLTQRANDTLLRLKREADEREAVADE